MQGEKEQKEKLIKIIQVSEILYAYLWLPETGSVWQYIYVSGKAKNRFFYVT